MSEALLEIRDLATHFRTRDGLVRAVDGVDLSVGRGETLGVVGESGSGKSVTAMSLMQLVEPPGQVVRGKVLLEGEDLLAMTEREMLHVRGKRLAMIFQDPSTSLNATVSVGEQLLEAVKIEKYDAWRAGPLRGAGRALRDKVLPDRAYERRSRASAVDLLRSVHLSSPAERLGQYPFMLSGGMLQRVMITVALAAHPEVLIADEPTTALDVTIQAQILDILRERKAARGLTTVLITHDLGVIAEMCDRVAVMYAGQIVEQATATALFAAPKHPYTQGLLASMPSIDQPTAAAPIQGSVPDLITLPENECHFVARCPFAMEVCTTTRPLPFTLEGGRTVACHLYSEPLEHQRRLRREPVAVSAEQPVTATVIPLKVASAALLEVRDLSKHFQIRKGLFGMAAVVRAVDGISLEVNRGETFALVGESGCGKTTAAELMLRLQLPTSGDVLFEGRSLLAASGRQLKDLRQNMQVVFQNPRSSLDPRMRVKDIIAEPLFAHRDARYGARGAVEELLGMVGLSRRLGDRFPHELSGGQGQRVAVARALALRPKLVVLDEPTSALDVTVQAQLIRLLEQLQAELGLTYVFISHDLRIVRHFSDRIGVMYLGKIVETGPTETIYTAPRHPYTRALLAAVPKGTPQQRGDRPLILGEALEAGALVGGCRFRDRCPLAREVCAEVEPPLREVGPGQWSACHFAEETPSLDTAAGPVGAATN